MKKIFALLLLLVLLNEGYSQLQTGFHYIISNKKKIYTDSLARATKKIRPYSVNYWPWKLQHLKANVVQSGNIIKLDFWSLSQSDTLTGYAEWIDKTDANTFALKINKRVKIGDSYEFISIPYATTEFGVTTIPFKYRFGYIRGADSIQNDASANINAGIYIGRKWGRTHFYADKPALNTVSLTAAVFAGPTIVALTPENTFPKITSKSVNEVALSTGVALMFAKQDLSISFILGWDISVSGKTSYWNYANRSWIGFGIGYKLLVLGSGK